MGKRDRISGEAKERLQRYEEGLFEILGVSPQQQGRIQRYLHSDHLRYGALAGFMVILVHVHSFHHYGWKPIINTPFLVRTEPFILLLWILGVVTTGYAYTRHRQQYKAPTDYDSQYMALHSSWLAYKQLTKDNLQNAINFWENGGYWMHTDDYSGPSELRELYDKYEDAENQVEILREQLPNALEHAMGTGVEEIVLSPDSFPDTYRPLVTEFNKCYNSGSYSAATILLRKMTEKLLMDVLSLHYGPESKEAQNVNRLHNAIEMLISDMDEFRQYSNKVNSDMFIQSLRTARLRGNAAAHEVDTQTSKEELETFIDDILFSVKVLSQIRQQLVETTPEYVDENGELTVKNADDNDYKPKPGAVGSDELDHIDGQE